MLPIFSCYSCHEGYIYALKVYFITPILVNNSNCVIIIVTENGIVASRRVLPKRRDHVKRQREQDHSPRVGQRPWTPEEDERLKLLYEVGVPLSQLSMEFNRTIDAIENRVVARRLIRPSSTKWQKAMVTWETHDLTPFHYEYSRGRLRG